MNKLLGCVLLAAPFITIIVFYASVHGVLVALGGIALTLLILGMFFLGFWLLGA